VAEFSFDVVSEFDPAELTNAIDQARREVSTRYDFKDTQTMFDRRDQVILIDSASEERAKAALQVLREKAARRQLSPKLFKADDPKTVGKGRGQIEVHLNAGITDDTLLMRMSEDQFTRVIDANLTGAFRVVKRATRNMLRARFGRIVFISSVVGLMGSPGQVNYAASKAGMIGMARSISRELGSRNITANVVAPGFVATDMTDALSEDRRKDILGQIPLGRYASVDEVAAAVTFLASDGGAYITGAVLPVDGGLGMGH